MMIGSRRYRWAHLARRFVGSCSNRAPSTAEEARVREMLSDAEWSMWVEMEGRDRRHALTVLARFDASGPPAPGPVRVAVLLHDAGKSESRLGVVLRVVATLVGPRGSRFRAYHDHERIGAARARALGLDEEVLAVLERRADAAVLARLDAADDV